MDLCFLIGTVQNGPILHIYSVTHPDGIHISPDHRIEPDAAALSHLHIPYDGGIRGDETFLAKAWMYTLYRKNNGHVE
jgi:hypothetical protein